MRRFTFWQPEKFFILALSTVEYLVAQSCPSASLIVYQLKLLQESYRHLLYHVKELSSLGNFLLKYAWKVFKAPLDTYIEIICC